MRAAAITLDGDGTLWDFDSVMRHALGITLGELRRWYPGPDSDALTVDEMIQIRDEVAARYANDWSRLEEIRRAAFVVTLDRLGADHDRADELNALYLRHRFEDIELFPDVLPCLDELGRGRPIGLLSNGNSYPERCGLQDRLSFAVFAQDHGVAKPDPRLFLIAAKAAECAIEDLVHVGDGEADIVGARRSGCMSVLIHRSGGTPPPYAELADFTITDLRDLPSILADT